MVVILGARQCGKSTLSKMLGQDWKYYDLENPTHFGLIQNDPILFLLENSKHIIVDEAQRSPALFASLRSIVDEDPSQKFGTF